MRASLVLLLAAVVAACAACGTEGKVSQFENGGGADASVRGNGSGVGEFSTDSGAQAGQLLRVDPPTAVVTVTGPLATASGGTTLRAILDGSPVAASWSLDNAAVGTISPAGVFTANVVAGKTTVTARVGALTATAEVTVKLKIEDNLANLSDADRAKLRGGGAADAGFKWLYPYDRTVFPRGLPAPTLQFGGGPAAAYYLRVTSSALEYEGFYPGGGGAPRVALSEAWWKTVTASAGAADPVRVEVTKLAGGAVTGPVTETWHVAQGNLKGTVYYNSYNSALAGNVGAVLRVKPGKPAEVFIGSVDAGGASHRCIVCHSVSASGNALVTGVMWSAAAPYNGNPLYSAIFGIGQGGVAQAKRTDPDGRRFSFGALTPDGKYVLGNAVPTDFPNVRGVAAPGGFPTRLYDGATGQPVSDAYFGGATPRHFLTPAFSPDARRLAFSDRNASAGHTLSMLDFDAAASPPAFSRYAVLASDAGKVLGWPSFTPDSKAVVFHAGESFDTAQHQTGDTLARRAADLRWVDVATKRVAPLDALNGYAPKAGGGTQCYLPYGEAEDANMNYEPTVLPAAVGGYYWVVFTSRRSFGNTIYDGPRSINAAGDKAFDNGERPGRGYRKKLWVAAIDIDAAPGSDPSHPAFFLEGQEAQAGNMRGFWALDPCKSNGADCETGDECCGGFCRQVTAADGGIGKQCVPVPAGCSNDSERCNVDADCCNAPSVRCINHSCAAGPPPR